MTEKTTRDAILAAFEKHREEPGGHCDETRFLDFLMADGRRLAEVRNGFRSLARLNAFYDTLQLSCGVCLGADDAEKSWAVSALAAHIDGKKGNRAAQLALVKKRLKAAEGEIFGGTGRILFFILLPFLSFAWLATGSLHFKIILTGFGLLLPGGVVWLQWHEVRFYRALLRILSR